MVPESLKLGGLFNLDEKLDQISLYEEKMSMPNFWDDQKAAQKMMNEMNAIKRFVDQFQSLNEQYEDISTWMQLAEEEQDAKLAQEMSEQSLQLANQFNEFELSLLLNQPYDTNDAILELHPGAGGTESQDWASMLLRMYTRWAEKRGFKVEIVDYLAGDEAGLKSVTLSIKGFNAYGFLRSEKGVHRLVRISPFDSSGRRHTSFVSCEIMPQIDDDVEVEIRTEDLKVDTYRASGAGGQHINTTDSAVRITHMPTGVVVSCQTERSQIKNRERAMKMLRAKLFERKLQEQAEQLAAIKGEQSAIAWGSQIRSYVFCPYTMVKDHRTLHETGNVNAVMDGDLDPFIDAFLRAKMFHSADGADDDV